MIYLRAIANRPGARLNVRAVLAERRGSLRILRLVESFQPGDGFSFDPKLRGATLRPEAPFSGAAAYRRRANRHRWTGDLAVDFPGRSNVLLTGTRFHASLAHAHLTREKRYDE